MTAEAPSQLTIEPDRYLDCRRPEWGEHEAAGQIRYEPEEGARRAVVVVADTCTEVLEALTR